MSEQILVVLITVVVGGIITGGVSIILKRIDLKANLANTEVTRSTNEVAAMVETLKGMEILLNHQRIESDRKTRELEACKQEVEDLEILLNREKERRGQNEKLDKRSTRKTES